MGFKILDFLKIKSYSMSYEIKEVISASTKKQN